MPHSAAIANRVLHRTLRWTANATPRRTPSHTHSHSRSHSQPHSGSCVGEKARVRDYVPHAVYRTARTVAMVFVLPIILDLVGHAVEPGAGALATTGLWRPLAASIIGLFPSCATSVALTEGFRAGMASFPP